MVVFNIVKDNNLQAFNEKVMVKGGENSFLIVLVWFPKNGKREIGEGILDNAGVGISDVSVN